MKCDFNLLGNYRIEVSGWGLDKNFFVEQTDLDWAQDGEKTVWLHHELPEGGVVFVRLLVPESTSTSVPVTYKVHTVSPMGCDGSCEMRLTQMHPRSKESNAGSLASKLLEDMQRRSEASEYPETRELEEILQ
jgi:hypothetical protein